MKKEDFRTKYHCCMVQVGGEDSNDNDIFRIIISVEKMCDEMGIKCRQLGNKQSLRLWITDPFMPERPRYLPYISLISMKIFFWILKIPKLFPKTLRTLKLNCLECL